MAFRLNQRFLSSLVFEEMDESGKHFRISLKVNETATK